MSSSLLTKLMNKCLAGNDLFTLTVLVVSILFSNRVFISTEDQRHKSKYEERDADQVFITAGNTIESVDIFKLLGSIDI